MRRRLRVAAHRSTTAHLCSVYPFQAEMGLGHRGVYLGTNLLTGGGGFAFDPFEAYQAGYVTNPNVLVAGEPGTGKSSFVKTFMARALAVFGAPRRDPHPRVRRPTGRWVAIADPKGEYAPLADALGLPVVRLYPGGSSRINPLDTGPADGARRRDERLRRRTDLVAALLAQVLRRELAPVEDAALGWAVQTLDDTGPVPTLRDVAAFLRDPDPVMQERARLPTDALSRQLDPIVFALDKLLDRSLRGMFDAATTVDVDWSGPGIVLDLSVVHHDDEALRLVLLAATAWLQNILARRDGQHRIQVLDEAWRLLGSEQTTRYLQACWKLCRDYGVANIAVVHRISDLRSQADDGTTTAKVSMGLLADTQTRVLFRQASDQLAETRRLLALNATETEVLGQLRRGRALWKVGGRSAVVQHHIGPAEIAICDTDTRMRARAEPPV
ncbi:MAG TPA: ATP-binding protein [Acidimicrobiia bacterium]|nr:ATP-binding protein [Acidimicrobiia bacterium]